MKITDDVVFQGWLTDKDTFRLVFTEAGAHAVVGTRTASPVGSLTGSESQRRGAAICGEHECSNFTDPWGGIGSIRSDSDQL